jgi:DNA polymerase III alpha subunit
VNYSRRNFAVREIAEEDRGKFPPSHGGVSHSAQRMPRVIRNLNELNREHPSGRDHKALFMGLDQVRDLSRRTIERILRYAPFASLEDFLTRVDPRQPEAVNLASVGALDGFGRIPSILRRLQAGDWQMGQMSLFDWNDAHNDDDWTLEQRLIAQQDLLGASLDAHPLELVADQISAAGALTTLEALDQIGRRVTVAGVRQSSHPSRTARGVMLFLTLEDLAGMLEVTVFPELYRQAKTLLGSSTPMLLTGVMEIDAARGEPFLRAEKVESIS